MTRPPRAWHPQRVVQRYSLDAKGMPVSLVTTSQVKALEPVDHLRYVFDTNEVAVEGITNCYTVGPDPEPDTDDPKYWAKDLWLHKILAKGETREVRHRTIFSYSKPPPNELVQGGAAYGLPYATLVVEFHERKARVRRPRWELLDASGVILESGPLTMEEDGLPYLHHDVFDLPPNHFAAIRWDWAP